MCGNFSLHYSSLAVICFYSCCSLPPTFSPPSLSHPLLSHLRLSLPHSSLSPPPFPSTLFSLTSVSLSHPLLSHRHLSLPPSSLSPPPFPSTLFSLTATFPFHPLLSHLCLRLMICYTRRCRLSRSGWATRSCRGQSTVPSGRSVTGKFCTCRLRTATPAPLWPGEREREREREREPCSLSKLYAVYNIVC